MRMIQMTAIVLLVALNAHADEEATAPTDAFQAMLTHSLYFTETQGELATMTMVQKSVDGKALKENNLIAAIRNHDGYLETVILVKEDGTMFFSRQAIRETEPSNESWLYIPPIPGVKNSGKVLRLNANTLQQSFIRSDFYNIDLEQVNVFAGEIYDLMTQSPLQIKADSERYGERLITFDQNMDITQIDYLKNGILHRRALWSDYKAHRSTRFNVTRFKKGAAAGSSEFTATYRLATDLPDAIFDRDDVRRAGQILEGLAVK